MEGEKIDEGGRRSKGKKCGFPGEEANREDGGEKKKKVNQKMQQKRESI